jgi:hypothetical protein
MPKGGKSGTGIKGIYQASNTREGGAAKWVAEFNKAGHRVYLGTFDSVDEATAALKAALKETFGDMVLPDKMDPYEPTPLERKDMDEMEYPVSIHHRASIFNLMKREAV